MANTIEYAQKFVPVIDGIYKNGALTADLEATAQVDFTNTKTVKVMKIEAPGLGDYSRENGYPEGGGSLTWEDMTLEEDRGTEFSVDRMDNEETLGEAFGMFMNEFMRTKVIPELDAYRFAKYAKAVTPVSGDLADGAAVVAALREAATEMDEKEVPTESRILYITPTYYGLVEDMDTNKSRAVLARFGKIVQVPQTRFYTDITLNSGAGAWGYAKGAGAKNLNFLVVEKSAVVQKVKFVLPKIFTPDENQDKDAWKFQYRHYHDALVYENKVNGIYAHCATT